MTARRRARRRARNLERRAAEVYVTLEVEKQLARQQLAERRARAAEFWRRPCP